MEEAGNGGLGVAKDVIFRCEGMSAAKNETGISFFASCLLPLNPSLMHSTRTDTDTYGAIFICVQLLLFLPRGRSTQVGGVVSRVTLYDIRIRKERLRTEKILLLAFGSQARGAGRGCQIGSPQHTRRKPIPIHTGLHVCMCSYYYFPRVGARLKSGVSGVVSRVTSYTI